MSNKAAVNEWPSQSMSAMRLATLWQSSVAARTEAGRPVPFSPKQFGQLKYLLKSIGNETACVMRWAIDNWDRFTWGARSAAGLSSAPDRPHIGFLVAHYDVAINMMAKSVPYAIPKLMARMSPPQGPSPALVQSIAPAADIAALRSRVMQPNPEAHTITADQLSAMLAELDTSSPSR